MGWAMSSHDHSVNFLENGFAIFKVQSFESRNVTSIVEDQVQVTEGDFPFKGPSHSKHKPERWTRGETPGPKLILVDFEMVAGATLTTRDLLAVLSLEGLGSGRGTNQ